MHPHATRALAAALLAGASGLAVGATRTTSFTVSATVVSNCFINLASTMAFGTYIAGAGNINQTSTIAVRCTNGTPYGIGLSVGTGAGSTFAQRTMSSATAVGSRLQYNLYNNAAHSNAPWNNPAAAAARPRTQGGIGTGLGNVITHTVYGQLQDSVTSRAAVPANNYISTITVTLNY
jgi:spore coat protein U-like protein